MNAALTVVKQTSRLEPPWTLATSSRYVIAYLGVSPGSHGLLNSPITSTLQPARSRNPTKHPSREEASLLADLLNFI